MFTNNLHIFIDSQNLTILLTRLIKLKTLAIFLINFVLNGVPTFYTRGVALNIIIIKWGQFYKIS